MSFFASLRALGPVIVGATAVALVACGSAVDDTSSATGAANGAGSGGAAATSTGTGGTAQCTGGAAQGTGGAAQGGAAQGGAGGGGVTTTCTVTNTVIALPEGSPCGVPSGDPCDPGSMCTYGTYCAGTDCAGTLEGVCTKIPDDCAAAGGPAVRDCWGKCYENGCYAAKSYATFVEDDTCAVAGAGGAG